LFESGPKHPQVRQRAHHLGYFFHALQLIEFFRRRQVHSVLLQPLEQAGPRADRLEGEDVLEVGLPGLGRDLVAKRLEGSVRELLKALFHLRDMVCLLLPG
jgi:hypothetical protein